MISSTKLLLWSIASLMFGLARFVPYGLAEQSASSMPPTYQRTLLADLDVSQSEWSAFLSKTLERDIARWRRRAPLRAADVTSLLLRQRTRQQLASVLRLVLIYNNRIHWPDREDANGSTTPPVPSSPLKQAFHATVSPLLESGELQLPNVLFLFNSDDNRPRFCGPGRNCSVPAISLIKTAPGSVPWVSGDTDGPDGGGAGSGAAGAADSGGITGVGGRGDDGVSDDGVSDDGVSDDAEDDDDDDDDDILIPQMLWMPDSLHSLPWLEKQDLAFFRGSPYCSGYWYGKFHCAHMCPRPYLTWRSLEDEQMRRPRTLDVGIVQKYYPSMSYMGIPPALRRPCVPLDLPVKPPVPLAEHSRYRWLLHLEGITASYRLAQLMSINSLVLVQRSPWVEYFYRALRPGVHYVPFWNTTERRVDDVYDVVSELRRRDSAEPSYVQSIVRQAQEFTARFLTPAARVRYLRDALTAYKSLFPDMDPFLEGYVAELRGRGFNITG